MARIPQQELDHLKAEVSLLDLVRRQGYEAKRQGKDYAVHCPFHEGDDTPSLIISPDKNLFHCFGCEASGSVVDWVMKTEGVSFRLAVEMLRGDLSSFSRCVVERGKAAIKRTTRPKLDCPVSSEGDDQKLLSRCRDPWSPAGSGHLAIQWP